MQDYSYTATQTEQLIANCPICCAGSSAVGALASPPSPPSVDNTSLPSPPPPPFIIPEQSGATLTLTLDPTVTFTTVEREQLLDAIAVQTGIPKEQLTLGEASVVYSQAERAERNQVKLYITVPDDDGEGQLRAEGLAAMIVEDVQFPTFVVSTEVDERPNQDLTMDEVPPPTAWAYVLPITIGAIFCLCACVGGCFFLRRAGVFVARPGRRKMPALADLEGDNSSLAIEYNPNAAKSDEPFAEWAAPTPRSNSQEQRHKRSLLEDSKAGGGGTAGRRSQAHPAKMSSHI